MHVPRCVRVLSHWERVVSFVYARCRLGTGAMVVIYLVWMVELQYLRWYSFATRVLR